MEHPLLGRQLKKIGVEDPSSAPDADTWRQLLERVNQTYTEVDEDRYTLERSLAISSTEMQQMYESISGEKRALEIITRDIPLPDALNALIRVIEEQSEGMLCSILLLDQNGTHLLYGAAPNLPEEYNRAVDGIAIGPNVGSCGTAAYRKEPVIVSDIASDPLWADFRDLALSHGLRACWSMPVSAANGDLMGTFAIYYREPRSPTPRDLRLIERATHTAGIAIERSRAEVALRKLSSAVEQTSDSMFITDRHGLIEYVNPAFESLSGYTRKELIGKTASILQSGVQTEEFYKELWETILDGHTFRAEFTNRKKNGELYYEEKIITPIRDAQGNVTHFVSTGRDISARRQAEQALRESEERYRDLFENASDLVQIVAPDGSLMYVNRAWRETLGYSAEEVSGLSLFDVLHPDVREGCGELFQQLLTGSEKNHKDIEVRFLAKDGRTISVEGNCNCRFRDGEAVAVQAFFHDITDRKQAEETIRHLAYHDALTGLPNRTLFTDRLNVALAQASRRDQMIAVLFLDLDHFKMVNDTVGHGAGDELLRRAAERLAGLVRQGDTVARMGGDEFTVLLTDIAGAEEVIDVARRAIDACRQPWDIDGHEFHVTTSIGIAMYPNDGEDADTLIRNADTAMYRAKEQGRDKYAPFTAAMNARIVERLTMESDLRRGLERDEFVVHYQPQVDIASGRMVGAEALVRWQHPERGLVPPVEFISVAEEVGLIVPLGTWVLKTACKQNVAWQRAGYAPMLVAVNLSARQFQQRDLLGTLTQVLEESGMDPQYLQLEITEGEAMRNTRLTVAALRELREMGVQIAIDDFGTGHSSLSYLKRFPVTALKIDRSFVRDLIVDPSDAAITAAILAMAKSLKLRVIAEGVETEEQLAFLRDRGCDAMQGFLVSKPVPAHALESMLSRRGRQQIPAGRRG